MNGSSIKRLAEVADLARLDIEAASLTLRSEAGGKMTAFYAGMYARGKREVEGDGLPFEVNVSATRFRALAMMFADEQKVTLSPTDNGLAIRSASSQVQLARWGELAEDDLIPPTARDSEFSVRIPADTLIREIEAASAFVSESRTRPALTGVRLDFNEGLQFTAYDGFGALYQSQNKVSVRADVPGYVTLPPEDFLLGAQLISEGNVIVSKPKGLGAVFVYNQRAIFRSVTIVAEWPDISKLTQARNATHFKVDAAQIRNLVSATKALEASNDIEVSMVKDRVMFRSTSEAGAFVTTIKGKINAPLKYDIDLLAKAIKLGPVLDFYVPEQAHEPTIVECDNRRCWISTRI